MRKTLFPDHTQKEKQAWREVWASQRGRQFASGLLLFGFEGGVAPWCAYDYQIMITAIKPQTKDSEFLRITASTLGVVVVCTWGLLAILPMYSKSLAFLVPAAVAVKLNRRKLSSGREWWSQPTTSLQLPCCLFLRSVLLAIKGICRGFHLTLTCSSVVSEILFLLQKFSTEED